MGEGGKVTLTLQSHEGRYYLANLDDTGCMGTPYFNKNSKNLCRSCPTYFKRAEQAIAAGRRVGFEVVVKGKVKKQRDDRFHN